MEHPRNGDVTVSFEQALFGRRRNGGFPNYLDVVPAAVGAGHARWPLPPHGSASRRRTYADGELDVFAAERYFKGAMDGCDYKVDIAPAVVPAEMAAAAARPAVVVSRPAWARASVASTGSGASANSQSGLLRDERRRQGYRGEKCCMQVGGLLRLRSCSGKRSVRVDGGASTEATGPGDEPATATGIEWYRDLRMDKAGRFGLARDGSHGVVAPGLPPNLNLGAAKVAAIGREEMTPAEYSSGLSFRRNFTLLAPVKVTMPAAGGGGGARDDDDVGSESSSDLFEIKSLMIDDGPYEPSEASIQWSVVTASAADVSVASEPRGGVSASSGRTPVAMRPYRHDRSVGLLTGCVSHRAVDVSAMAAVRRPPGPPAASATTRRRNEMSRHAQNGHL
ncbi:hypothetical protein GUJ93_ZPchr0010g8071 [Zizania palustris]|uniref:Uncharacterized protein n=1 Tax=Zizania palustris TaxID=103762 RepID=A0A8J5WEL8_ZIZPA|nr:hypothetical protein GUJ93_ZPchr0010g8071 [Zizania palustris]